MKLFHYQVINSGTRGAREELCVLADTKEEADGIVDDDGYDLRTVAELVPVQGSLDNLPSNRELTDPNADCL